MNPNPQPQGVNNCSNLLNDDKSRVGYSVQCSNISYQKIQGLSSVKEALKYQKHNLFTKFIRKRKKITFFITCKQIGFTTFAA